MLSTYMKTARKQLKMILIVIMVIMITILLISCVTPYLIPISKYPDLIDVYPYLSSQYMEVNTIRLHYRLYTPTVDPKGNVLLIHGLGGSTYSFEKTIPSLTAAGFVVVAVDLPGFGYSDRSGNIDHSQNARSTLLWTFLDRLPSDIPQVRWHLVGHSMGAATAVRMALARQERTASITIIDGAFGNPDSKRNVPLWIPSVIRWIQVLVQYRFSNPKQIEKILEQGYLTSPNEKDIKGYREPLLIDGTARQVPSLLKTSTDVQIEELGSLNMPVLIVWGKNDPWTPVADVDRIAQILPGATYHIIEHAGHFPLETHPDVTNSILVDFLQ